MPRLSRWRLCLMGEEEPPRLRIWRMAHTRLAQEEGAVRSTRDAEIEAVRAVYIESYGEALAMIARVRAIIAKHYPAGKVPPVNVEAQILGNIGNSLECGGEAAVRDAIGYLPTWTPAETGCP
jgi:hypothetical protein